MVLGETRVKIGNSVQVVSSFDHGMYKLGDQKTTLTQWELLDNRCGAGVKLDDDLRRSILHLVSKYVAMKSTVLPYYLSSGNVTTGMLWNINDAMRRASASGDKIDTKSNNTRIDELEAIKGQLDSIRDLSLKTFTNGSLNDTLPANFRGVKCDKALLKFAQQPGSLSQLNCLGEVGIQADNNLRQGCLFTGGVVREGHTIALPAERTSSSWEGMIRSVTRLLACTYRLAPVEGLLDAFAPLISEEANVLDLYHSHWAENLRHSLGELYIRYTKSADVVDSELEGEKSFALRFALDRCKTFRQSLPPAVVVGCWARDADMYGRAGLDSLDTTHFMHARSGSGIHELLLGNDSSSDAVQRISTRSTISFRMQGI